ncbi:hypothetical protein NEMBOFW57_000355 [Staphylotrichum longicolle]|uniref:Uncharacterized protein n=1 Tax=Staphylotrichum longicolle TaxID=669026 RepID=A0AAD4I1K5_9PEZI|nr:hypothetical protein NEMBOFW57_000355 [Staphylotrichum longicolle]
MLSETWQIWGSRTQKPPAQQGGITQQMQGLNLGSAPAGNRGGGYEYAEVPSFKYGDATGYGNTTGYASYGSQQSVGYATQAVGYAQQPGGYAQQPGGYAQQPARSSPSPQPGQAAVVLPTRESVEAAQKMLYKLETRGKVRCFKVKKVGRWKTDDPWKTGAYMYLPQLQLPQQQQQRSAAKPAPAAPSSRGASQQKARYWCDCKKGFYEKDDLLRHLDKHKNHRREK